jgi:cytochrome b
MTILQAGIEAGGARPPATLHVWDLLVRTFHWSLVVLFVIAFVSGDEIEWLHLSAGYSIAGLIALRVVWGFVGPRHARFADFLRSPRETLAYACDLALRRPRRYIGHNPLGALMIVALLGTLAGLAVTGHMMTTDAFWGAKWVEEVHETLAYAMIALIGLHVLGVVMSSLTHRENLVKAMVTGRKRST